MIQFLIQRAGSRETVGSLHQVSWERWEHFPEAAEDHVTQVDSSVALLSSACGVSEDVATLIHQ